MHARQKKGGGGGGQLPPASNFAVQIIRLANDPWIDYNEVQF